MTPLTDLVPEYLADLRAAGRRPDTLRNYRITLTMFMAYLGEQDASLSRRSIRGFLNSFTGKQSTNASRYRNLSAFCSWLVREGEIDQSPMKGMTMPKATPPVIQPFTEAEIEKILSVCGETDFYSKRNRLIVLMFASTGMRLGELVSILRENVHYEERVILISGKTGPRVVPISDRAAAALRSYNRKRPRTHAYYHDPHLFIGKRGPLTEDGVDDIIRQIGKKSGVADVHCHRFRHSFADAWLSAGGGEMSLMTIAGWSSPSMLARYTAARKTERALDEYRRMAL